MNIKIQLQLLVQMASQKSFRKDFTIGWYSVLYIKVQLIEVFLYFSSLKPPLAFRLTCLPQASCFFCTGR